MSSPPSAPQRIARPPLVAGGVLLILLAAALLESAHRISADEGVILSGAWNLHQGRIIYRDFFPLASPGSFYLVALAFSITPSYAAALIASVIVQLVSVGALFACARRLIPRPGWAFAIAMAWLLVGGVGYPLINHNSHSSFLAVVAMWAMLRYLQEPRHYRALVAGLGAGVVFFFLQTKGVVLLAGLGAAPFLAPRPLKFRLLSVLAAGAGFGAVALAGYGCWGSGPFVAPLRVAGGYLTHAHRTLSYLPLGISIFLCGLLGWGLAAFRLFTPATRFILLMQCGLILGTLNLPDPQHLLINAFPGLLLAGLVLHHLFANHLSRLVHRVLLGLGLVLVHLLCLLVVTHNRAVTATSRDLIATVTRIVGPDRIFVTPFLPNFYFELKKNNPYYDDISTSTIAPAAHLERNLAVLKREQPRFVLTNYPMVAKYGHDRNNPLDTYIESAYAPREVLGDLVVWERRER